MQLGQLLVGSFWPAGIKLSEVAGMALQMIRQQVNSSNYKEKYRDGNRRQDRDGLYTMDSDRSPTDKGSL